MLKDEGYMSGKAIMDPFTPHSLPAVAGSTACHFTDHFATEHLPTTLRVLYLKNITQFDGLERLP